MRATTFGASLLRGNHSATKIVSVILLATMAPLMRFLKWSLTLDWDSGKLLVP